MTTPTNSALHMMEGQGLSDEQIVAIATKAHAEGRLLWIGFEKDEDGRYTIPTLSGSDFQLVRAVLEAVPPKTALDHFADEVEASGEAEKHAARDQAISGDGWLLDSEGRRLVGTSYHYTAQSIKALIWELQALEDPRMTTQADFENRDWRAWCGILHRVMSGLASEVPLAPESAPAGQRIVDGDVEGED